MVDYCENILRFDMATPTVMQARLCYSQYMVAFSHPSVLAVVLGYTLYEVDTWPDRALKASRKYHQEFSSCLPIKEVIRPKET